MAEQVGRHPRHVAGVGRAQANAASGLGLDHHGGHRQAVVVLERVPGIPVQVDDGYAEGLDGRCRLRIDGVDEGARLDPGRGHRATAEQLELEPVGQHPPADALAIVATRGPGVGGDRHLGMVDQVLPHPRQVRLHRNVVLRQLLGRPDTREHQKLRGHQRTRRQDHLALRAHPVHLALAVAVLDAHGASVFDQYLLDLAVERDLEPRVLAQRLHVGVGSRAALARPIHELIEADPGLTLAIEVAVVGQPRRLGGLDKPARGHIHMTGIRDLEWPAAPVVFIDQTVVVLHPAKVLEHPLPGPVGPRRVAGESPIPVVVVLGPPAHVDLGIDRGTAAEHVALGNVMDPSPQMSLRLGLVIAHELRAIDHLEDARRHVEQRVVVGRARLQKQHPGTLLAHQAGGYHAPGGPAPDNNMIDVAHSFSPAKKVLRTNSHEASR